MDWTFPSGALIEFSHLQYLKDVASHLSKQYELIIFDQLEQFLEGQFWALFGRARSSCGIQPYVRAACNPDPDSFLYDGGNGLISWWIGEDGYPIPERSGVIRWFVRDTDDELIWADTKEELQKLAPHICADDPEAPNSITFIASSLDDNEALTKADPKYKSKLMAMPRVERARLLGGNWLIRPAAGLYFRRAMFEIIEAPPKRGVRKRLRAWDLASTKVSTENKDPDWTVGLRYSVMQDGGFVIEHVERLRDGPFGVERTVKNLARSDPKGTVVALWEDPGAAGKSSARHFARLLSGFIVKIVRASKDKVTYAGPASSQAEAGNIRVVRGAWNEPFFATLERFPVGHDDDVDALSLAHILLSNSNLARLRSLAAM
jgi:predicted phage terminase large subunit-like protein